VPQHRRLADLAGLQEGVGAFLGDVAHPTHNEIERRGTVHSVLRAVAPARDPFRLSPNGVVPQLRLGPRGARRVVRHARQSFVEAELG